jgi:putative tricarboxylic transport membrane protein
MTKRLAELLILSGYLILAVLLYRSTASYPVSVQGSTALYVRFLGMALGVFCCLEIFLWFKNRGQSESEKMTIATVPMRFWGLFILLLIYSTALSYLGFYLSSALFLPLAMLLLGAKKPLSIGLTSIGVLLFVYLVFAKLLEVPLPEGSLF